MREKLFGSSLANRIFNLILDSVRQLLKHQAIE